MEPVGVAGTYGGGMDSVVMWNQWVSRDVRGWDGQCGDVEPVGVAGTYGGGMDSVVMWSQWVSPGRTGVGWSVW